MSHHLGSVGRSVCSTPSLAAPPPKGPNPAAKLWSKRDQAFTMIAAPAAQAALQPSREALAAPLQPQALQSCSPLTQAHSAQRTAQQWPLGAAWFCVVGVTLDARSWAVKNGSAHLHRHSNHSIGRISSPCGDNRAAPVGAVPLQLQHQDLA